MCLTPIRFIDGGGLLRTVSCQNCSSCRASRKRDWIGRAIAEKRHANGAHFLTLTYGTDRRIGGAEDLPGARVLTYPDVQRWLKRIRAAGFPVRYIVAGEYGSAKARAHWHALLYWTGKVPAVPEQTRDANGQLRCWADPFWPAGLTQWDECHEKTAGYLTKYMQKAIDDPHQQSMVRVSKRPLLGAAFFDDWARQHVSQGLSPQDRRYWFSDVKDPKTGKPWEYYMNDACAHFMCASFLRQWAEGPGGFPPASELLDWHQDRMAQRPSLVVPSRFVRRDRPALPVPHGGVARFSEAHNTWVCDDGDRRLFWSWDEEGQRAWAPKFVTEAEAERRRKAVVLPPPQYRLGRRPKAESRDEAKRRADRRAYEEAMRDREVPADGAPARDAAKVTKAADS